MAVIHPWKKQMFPVIGILTSRKKDGSIAGNSTLFKKLQKKLISLDGVSFIFTLDGVHDNTIEGFTYIPEENGWEKIIAPYPDLIYNRIPFRKSEQEVKSSEFFSLLKERNIPFFNPGFIDKQELYHLFKNHPILQSYIPATIPAIEKETLSAFITEFQSIYLKPAKSARGKGIFKLAVDTQKKVLLRGINKNEDYLSFDHFWSEWKNILTTKNYLAQEEIKSSLFNQKRFDFRVLAIAEHDYYVVTGIGIRQAQKQDITTHIPMGGRLLSYQLFQTKEHDHFFQMLVEQIGKALSDQYGFFGEFSIDVGVTPSGQYFVYEVNSKPMSFDETEIEERKIDLLCQLFLQLTTVKNK